MVNVEKMVNVQLTESSANVVHQFLTRCFEEAWKCDTERGASMSAQEHIILNTVIQALEQSGLILNPAV